MHLFWWIIWVLLLVWIFMTPYTIPGEMRPKEDPFDILKKRFAKGEINEEEYKKKKKFLEEDRKSSKDQSKDKK